MKRIKINKKAFTLVELLVVIVILALLIIITSVTIFNILNKVYGNIEIQNAKILIKRVNEEILSVNLLNDKKNLSGTYIVHDNKGYFLNSFGKLERYKDFDNDQNLCNYCVIKINDDNKINLLMEGKEQNIKKEFNSDELIIEKLTISRDEDSLYNEITLFANLYITNNVINNKERFIIEGNKIYKIKDDGEKETVSELKNSYSNSDSKLVITSNSQYTIEITTNDNITMINNSEGKLIEKNDINSEYSKEVLNLYEELKYIAEKYINNNNITDDVYFEYNNGIMSVVDEFGNKVSNVQMNKNIFGNGELKINKNKEFSVVIYQDNFDIKNDYGNLKLYNEDLKYSREMSLLIKNLDRLEKLSAKYAGTTKSSTYNNYYKKTWLVPFYIRRLKYNSTNYITITGNDSDFVTYVSNNASYLKNYFTNINNFTVNSDTIDLKHMMASLAGNIYNTDGWYNLVYAELEYDCFVSWAGDLHEFIEFNILKNDIKTKYGDFGSATYQLLGNNLTRFSLDDMYADVDNWNIYYNLRSNKESTIAELFDKYYSGQSSRNYKNRFKSFIRLMNAVGSDLGKTDFIGLVNYFTDMDRSWDTIGSLEIVPTEEEEKLIANNFIKWIQDKADNEK